MYQEVNPEYDDEDDDDGVDEIADHVVDPDFVSRIKDPKSFLQNWLEMRGIDMEFNFEEIVSSPIQEKQRKSKKKTTILIEPFRNMRKILS